MAATDMVASLQRAPDRAAVVRRIKNDAVGNVCAKRAYVAAGAVRELVNVAAATAAAPQLVAEALSALCSLLVRCEDGVRAFLAEPNALDVLLSALHAPPPLSVSHAAARALKVLATSTHAPVDARDAIADRPLAVAQLVALAAHNGPVCATAAATLAAIIRLPSHAATAIEAGALPALMPALLPRAHPVRTDAALDALAALADADPATAAAEIAEQGAPVAVLPLVRRTESAVTRLAACRLLARLRRARALDGRQEKSEIINAVIPQLITLLDCDQRDLRRHAACVLSEMVEQDDDMQRRATDEGAVACLAQFFRSEDPSASSNPMNTTPPSRIAFTPENTRGVDVDHATVALPMAQAALDALAALCANLDEARDRVVGDAKLWPLVIEYLGSDDPAVVLAAARCVRSLTRSVKILREDNCDEMVVALFLRLLETSQSTEVRRCVSAAVCNVVIGFSPVQALFLERGGVGVLVRLLRTTDAELKKSALCALKNVLFKAGVQTKRAVMGELGYDTLGSMCSDDSGDVRELAMHILRNLACFGAVHNDTTHLDVLLNQMGNQLVQLIENALSGNATPIAVQALYTACNIASGTEAHKQRIVNSQIPKLILRWLEHSEEKARIAALWCTINLSRKEHDNTNTTQRRPSRVSARRLAEAHELALLRRSTTRTIAELRSLQTQAQSPSASQDTPLSDNMVLDSGDEDAEPRAAPDAADDNSNDTAMQEPMDESADGEEAEDVKPATAAKSPASSRDAATAIEPVTESKQGGYSDRIRVLRILGYENALQALLSDPHVEVQGRARAALEHFTAAQPDAEALDYEPCSLLTRLNPPEHRHHAYHPMANSPVGLRVDAITAAAATTPASDESSAGDISEGSTLNTAAEDIRGAPPPPGLG